VVLFHTAVIAPTTSADRAYLFLASCGFSGVDLFFVLSGYLITGILLDQERSTRALGSFYARRALRTLPLYYAVLAASLLVLPRLVPPEKAARLASVSADVPWYVLHLSNVAIARAHAFRHPVLDVAWSLAIEEQFYLLWPLVVLACSRRAVLGISAAAFAFSLALRAALVTRGADAYATYVLTPCRMDALAMGAFLAAASRGPGGLGPHRRTAWIALAVALPIALVAIFVDYLPDRSIALPGRTWPLATVGFSAIAIAFGASLTLVITAPTTSPARAAFESPALAVLGKYSYGIYLVHLPIRAFVRDRLFGPSWSTARLRFPGVAGSEVPGQIMFDFVCMGLALGVAWATYHLFEARFLAMKRRFPLGERTAPLVR
jgi:peptidoglycan/LPS O-acetylase OafA/YrhL